jgi:hypothetical protein
MGGPNYAQFGNRVHAGRADVRAEAGHADGTHDLIVGGAGMEERNELGRADGSTNPIRQLERRPEDMERAAKRLRTARMRNKERFDRTHRLRPKKIEEGDWVLVYDSSLDNQHKATRKFARRWFEPYVVTSVNDDGTYHLAELDRTRIAVPVAGKRIKAFKKRHDSDPDLQSGESDEDDADGENSELIIEI